MISFTIANGKRYSIIATHWNGTVVFSNWIAGMYDAE
jgi:hypothetical protein